MKKIYLSLLMLSVILARSQSWQWVKLVQPATNFSGLGLKVGPNGQVYGYGNYQSSIAFTNGVSLSGTGAFICMFDTAGQCQWAQKISAGNGCGCPTGTASAAINGFDSQGNLIVSGMYCGCGADFGNGVTTPDIAHTMFLAKFNSSGQCLWVKTKASTSSDLIACTTMDTEDNIYLSIDNYASSVNFCGLSFSTSAAYFAKVNSNGVGVWSFITGSHTGGNNSFGINKISYGNNRLFCLGLFTNTTTLGSNTYTANGVADGYLACMDTGGVIIRSSVISGTGLETPNSILVLGDEICVLSQTNSYSVSAGTYTINTGTGQDKTFLIAYDTNLTVLNARNTANDSLGSGNFLVSDKWGNIYLQASNTGTTGFGNLSNVPAGNHLIKMNSSLTNFWYMESVNAAIAPDTLGNIYITDNFYNNQSYGPLSNTTTGFGITLGKIQNALTPVGGPAGREQNGISVYPNPGEGLFNLKVSAGIKNKKSVIITLIDAIGKEIPLSVFTQPDDLTLQVDLSSLAKGLYVVKVMADGVSYTAKLER